MQQKWTATIAILSLTTGATLGLCLPVTAAPNHLVINQVQVTGGTGKSSNDFIELFNPTSSALDLKGYRLIKRTQSGTADTTIKSWTTSAIIPAYGFYLWANSDYKVQTADVTTSQTIANDNGIALRQGAENTGTIIDSLGWGKISNGLYEGSPFPTNPTANTSLVRKPVAAGARQDTGNNAQDFELQNPSSPHNSASSPELTVAAVPQPSAATTNVASSTPVTTKTSSTKIVSTSGTNQVHGTVVVVPGMFSRVSLYLANPPLQVSLSTADWPKLSLGDTVTVSGKISQTISGPKLTLRTANDLTVTGHGAALAPTALTLAQVTTEHAAELITVQGKVSQASATTFSLTDGTSIVHITLKNRDTVWPKLYPGQQVAVTGIVVPGTSSVNLWPRSPDDVVKTAAAPPTRPNTNPAPQSAPNQYRGYLFLGLVVLMLGGTYLWEKYRLPMPLQFIKKYFTKQ